MSVISNRKPDQSSGEAGRHVLGSTDWVVGLNGRLVCLINLELLLGLAPESESQGVGPDLIGQIYCCRLSP